MTDARRESEIRDARMPVIFVGHGTPMNAVEENAFVATWRRWGETLPKPRAVLCVSAHWETRGTQVTAMPQPRTIHDFYGFPPELTAIRYPAPGDPQLAEALAAAEGVTRDESWGLDHGCWSVLKHVYPKADVPVVQLSLSRDLSPREHYALGRTLRDLRRQKILVIGSGNMVHNLRLVSFRDEDNGFGFDWALEANALFKQLIDEERHDALMDYPALGHAAQLAVPTPEHFLPMLYALALKEPGEPLRYFNDAPWGGSLTMTSFVIG